MGEGAGALDKEISPEEVLILRCRLFGAGFDMGREEVEQSGSFSLFFERQEEEKRRYFIHFSGSSVRGRGHERSNGRLVICESNS
jgi:hypothetical protein